MLRKKEDEKYFKIAVTGVAILLIGMVCFFLFYRIRGFGAFFHDSDRHFGAIYLWLCYCLCA